jgi:hypothetical protein
MQLDDYRAFTAALTDTLAQDPRVLGLIALGSMAEQDYLPDQWSDHDFFVITVSGEQEALRTDLSWLPGYRRLAFWFRETPHALRAVYDSGHLLEFVLFDKEELTAHARINRYRVLLDRSNIAALAADVAERTAQEAAGGSVDDRLLLGEFLTNLMVGAARFWRGERLSGHLFVKSYAMELLVRLVVKRIPAERHALLDNLAPTRRFDWVYPVLATGLDEAANLPPPEAAQRMLDIAEHALRGALPAASHEQFAVARRYLASFGFQAG